jgi:2,3,4,5-tetrahydropyridine-2-carboxylate N-succinyltransferase
MSPVPGAPDGTRRPPAPRSKPSTNPVLGEAVAESLSAEAVPPEAIPAEAVPGDPVPPEAIPAEAVSPEAIAEARPTAPVPADPLPAASAAHDPGSTPTVGVRTVNTPTIPSQTAHPMACVDPYADLRARVEELFAQISELVPGDDEALAVATEAVTLLDEGKVRVAEVTRSGEVVVHTWLKQAILLYFRLRSVEVVELGPFEFADKVPLKRGLARLGVRVVPGAFARFGAYLEPGVVLMPSYVNIGARVGAGTMVDTWATVGSCAQVGRRVHLAGGVGVGGVLEPPQAVPVVVEDDAFVGSRCILTEGARVGEGAVLGAGLVLNPSIPVIDAESGEELSRGVVPPWSVVVPAQRRRRYRGGTFFLPCALVVRRLEPGERHDKTALEALLRDHGVAT